MKVNVTIMEKSYHEKIKIENELKLRAMTKELPRFCQEFFLGTEHTTSSRTRLAYAYDLGIFFSFLHENNPVCRKYEIPSIPISFLDMITPLDIEEYLNYLKVYTKDGVEHTNDERGISRKLASLRSFYNYFFRKQMITSNPPDLVKTPKLHEKEIIRLDVDEVAMLLDEVESGEKLTAHQLAYHEQTKLRDLALLSLLLGTGIRVSECVGLDLNDVDFKNNGITVTRKGGNQMVVYFGDEVAGALRQYIENDRKASSPLSGHENALFLSTQRRRMGVQAVENMVKKYARQVTPNKKITPHKLRSTYGTTLYKETGDIYLVADVLGHKDVNTTKKHYAAIDEDRRRMAASAVKLRES